jgi:L-rhamnose mutarotase
LTENAAPDHRPKKRIAFTLRIHPGMGEGYDLRHNPVWPEMLDLLKRSGISNYSIFRRDEQLLLVMEVEDFDATWALLEADPINTRWQQSMAPYFDTNDPTKPGERFPMYEEVFYMP